MGDLVTEKRAYSEDGQSAGAMGKGNIVCLRCGATGVLGFSTLVAANKEKYKPIEKIAGLDLPCVRTQDHK